MALCYNGNSINQWYSRTYSGQRLSSSSTKPLGEILPLVLSSEKYFATDSTSPASHFWWKGWTNLEISDPMQGCFTCASKSCTRGIRTNENRNDCLLNHVRGFKHSDDFRLSKLKAKKPGIPPVERGEQPYFADYFVPTTFYRVLDHPQAQYVIAFFRLCLLTLFAEIILKSQCLLPSIKFQLLASKVNMTARFA